VYGTCLFADGGSSAGRLGADCKLGPTVVILSQRLRSSASGRTAAYNDIRQLRLLLSDIFLVVVITFSFFAGLRVTVSNGTLIIINTPIYFALWTLKLWNVYSDKLVLFYRKKRCWLVVCDIDHNETLIITSRPTSLPVRVIIRLSYKNSCSMGLFLNNSILSTRATWYNFLQWGLQNYFSLTLYNFNRKSCFKIKFTLIVSLVSFI